PPKGDLDDFGIDSVRLELADGMVLEDPRHGDQVIFFGDCCPAKPSLPFVDINFYIPQEEVMSIAYEWDTSSVADGEHEIKVVTPDGDEATATVLIDRDG